MPELQERLLWATSAAEDAISRLDERLRGCAFATGWAKRQDFLEAVAWAWNAGRGVSVEDLVLHDGGMDIRMPDEGLRASHSFLRARRKAALGGEGLLSGHGAAWLAGRHKHAPSASSSMAPEHLDTDAPLFKQLVAELDSLRKGETEGGQSATSDWIRLLALRHPRLPLVLQAAVALEGWRIVEPYPR